MKEIKYRVAKTGSDASLGTGGPGAHVRDCASELIPNRVKQGETRIRIAAINSLALTPSTSKGPN
jgi:hypothetical protein